MSTFEFLVELKKKGIDVSLNGDRLKLNAPKGALTADLKSELTGRKLEIIAFLQRAEEVESGAEMVQIEPIDRAGILPLSPAQERVWSLYELDPTNGALNVPVIWRLNGRLQVDALEKAVQHIVARHENLRSRFVVENGTPQVQILPSYQHALQRVQLSNLPEPEREAMRLIEAERTKRPFALTQVPPHRTTLYQLGEQSHILLLNFHQILFDWGAFTTLLQEMALFYNSFAQGTTPRLPPLDFQYVDFAHWQQSRLQGERLDALTDYWQAKTTRPYHLLQLPTSTDTDASKTAVQFTLDRPTTEALKAIGRKHGTTMFTTMLALYKTALTPYAPEDDVLVFTTTGQDRLELKQLIGLFANVNILHTDLSGNPSFNTVMERVKKSTIGMIEHQELPIEQVLELLNWQSTPTHNNIFQTVFIYQQNEPAPFSFEGVDFEMIATGDYLGGFDWRFFLEEEAGQIGGTVEFDHGRYARQTIEGFVTRFEQIVEQVIADPALTLDRLNPAGKVLASAVETAVDEITPPRRRH